MCSHCQHLCFEDLCPRGWQTGFMPGEKPQLLLPCPAAGKTWSCTGGPWGQRLRLPARTPLKITTVMLTLVNKKLIERAAGLRTAVRWHYGDYNWCGPDSRSLLSNNLLGHIVSSAICTVVDFLTPGSPQLKSSV